jgi:hypothetical protein
LIFGHFIIQNSKNKKNRKMKKRILFVTLILAIGCIAMAQVAPDTTKAPFIYVKGMGLWELIKANGLAILAIIYAVAEYYLGKSGKLKEGSIPHWLFNMIGRMIFKKAELIKTKETNRATFLARKAEKEAMAKRFSSAPKILLIAVILSGMSLAGYAQKSHPFRIYPFKVNQPTELVLGANGSKIDSTFFFGASVGTELFTKQIKSGEANFQVMPGVGYGLKWNPKWNPIQKSKSFLSLDLFLKAKQSKDELLDAETSTLGKYFDINVSPMIGVWDWFHIGFGPLFRIGTNKATPNYTDWVLSLSISTII